MKNARADWLFLDFDGVICDSLEECYRSSWLAHSDVEISEDHVQQPPFKKRYRDQFISCRPFIRSGEDYLAVHELLSKGSVPSSQTEFDAKLIAIGQQKLDDWKVRLYKVRELLLEHHRELWLSWNPLYAPMKRLLPQLCGHGKVRILSTKKAEFIHDILVYQNIEWPLERIVYSSSRSKLEYIAQISGKERSLFIDDQIEHLDFFHSSCDSRLALWGYVTEESRLRASKTLNLGDLAQVLKPWAMATI
jgi:hypothetical protein